MNFFPDFKTFLEIDLGGFHFKIVWYSIFILWAATLTFYISQRYARKKGYDKGMLEDYFFTMIPIAIIGARLYYCLFEWSNYIGDPIRILYVWEGGLAIHGGLIAAIVYAFFFFKRRGVNFLNIGDCILPNILLAQSIGRWGNFMNQEAYGQIVSEEYYANFPMFIKDHMYIEGAYRQPMFLYESIGNLIGFLLITLVYRKHGRNKRGDLMYAYIIWYGLVRVFVEGFRSDSLMFMNMKVAQLISIVFMIIGILGILGVYNKLFKRIYPFKKEKPIILFDADGTLIDTEQLIFDTFNNTFAKYAPDHSLSEEELHSFLGPTLDATFARYFKENQIVEILEYYRAYNFEHHDEYVKEMPHAKELLTYLKAEGYTIGVVSNKRHDLVKKGLTTADLIPFIDVIVGYDNIANAKPNPEGLITACQKAKYPVDDLIYVGDAQSDILAARNMGAYSIGYAPNEKTKQKLIEVKPCRMIENLLDLKEIIKEDREWNEFVI